MNPSLLDLENVVARILITLPKKTQDFLRYSMKAPGYLSQRLLSEKYPWPLGVVRLSREDFELELQAAQEELRLALLKVGITGMADFLDS